MRKGFKSILDVNPSLCEEWNYEKNYPLTPDKISFGNGRKVWWKCKRDHEWEADISHRNHGKQCPKCKFLVDPGKSLAFKYPKLASEWDWDKNKDFSCHDVHPLFNKKAWWKCKKGHEWKTNIKQRVRYDTGCPYCSHTKVCKETSLAQVNPILSREWHPNKNRNLTPYDFTAGSAKKVWWKCKKGHEWRAIISVRNYSKCRCPYCSKKVILKDGEFFQSMVEAYYYIMFKKQNKKFKHDKKYPDTNLRYDFYFPEENKYIEVTSYNRRGNKKYFKYLRKIVKKKHYVEKQLKGAFQFIHHEIREKEINVVRKNMKH